MDMKYCKDNWETLPVTCTAEERVEILKHNPHLLQQAMEQTRAMAVARWKRMRDHRNGIKREPSLTEDPSLLR